MSADARLPSIAERWSARDGTFLRGHRYEAMRRRSRAPAATPWRTMAAAFADCDDAECSVDNLGTSNVVPLTCKSLRAVHKSLADGRGVREALRPNDRQVYVAVALTALAVVLLCALGVFRRRKGAPAYAAAHPGSGPPWAVETPWDVDAAFRVGELPWHGYHAATRVGAGSWGRLPPRFHPAGVRGA